MRGHLGARGRLHTTSGACALSKNAGYNGVPEPGTAGCDLTCSAFFAVSSACKLQFEAQAGIAAAELHPRQAQSFKPPVLELCTPISKTDAQYGRHA